VHVFDEPWGGRPLPAKCPTQAPTPGSRPRCPRRPTRPGLSRSFTARQGRRVREYDADKSRLEGHGEVGVPIGSGGVRDVPPRCPGTSSGRSPYRPVRRGRQRYTRSAGTTSSRSGRRIPSGRGRPGHRHRWPRGYVARPSSGRRRAGSSATRGRSAAPGHPPAGARAPPDERARPGGEAIGQARVRAASGTHPDGRGRACARRVAGARAPLSRRPKKTQSRPSWTWPFAAICASSRVRTPSEGRTSLHKRLKPVEDDPDLKPLES